MEHWKCECTFVFWDGLLLSQVWKKKCNQISKFQGDLSFSLVLWPVIVWHCHWEDSLSPMSRNNEFDRSLALFVGFNMKQARPWMLRNMKIIWQFHAHPLHQKVSRFFGLRYIGEDFILGPSLVSFNRTIVPYEISKVNFRVETKILVSMSEEI